jgi:hypothetical protein
MTHGSAGTFDVDLSSGNGIECRSGGVNNSYNVVFTFSNNITNCGSANTGTVGAPNGKDCSVAVNVPTGNYVTVQLSGVTDVNASTGTFSTTFGVLVGDTNADDFVDSADITQTKSQSGAGVGSLNFREDLNADGFLDSGDITIVKAQSGTALPTARSAPPPSSATPTPPASGVDNATKKKTRKVPVHGGVAR